jgi:hypothetical protein
MTETDLYAQILAEHSHGHTRLFRVNAGMAYQGRVIERTAERLVLAPWYPIRLAPEGFSDLIGWTTVNMGEYGAHATFVGIEGKLGRKQPTEAQTNFLDLVRRSGGRAGIARSGADAGAILRGDLP